MTARRLVACLAVASLAACNTTPPAPKADPAAVEKEIRDLVSGWNRQLEARNDSAITELYAADAVVLPPNAPKISGRDGVRAFWQSLWPAKPTLKLTTVAVTSSASGDLAAEEGTFALALTMPDGSPVSDHGKYLVLWRKTAQGWKVVTDIYNSDEPAPPPPAPSKKK